MDLQTPSIWVIYVKFHISDELEGSNRRMSHSVLNDQI